MSQRSAGVPWRALCRGVAVAAALAVTAVGALAPAGVVAAATSDPTSRTVVLTSFDGTPIVVHFFPAQGLGAGDRVPTVLDGPGWGSPGDTNEDSPTVDALGAVGVGPLRTAGYNVVTWDPRGFGGSGGEAEVDSADFEARDVSAILDWVAQQPEVRLDGAGDPRVGMAGASYGGGVQLVTAATDHRVDAIVPVIAWNTLPSSLDKDGAVKTGWASILCGDGLGLGTLAGLVSPAGVQTGSVDPHVTDACVRGAATGEFPPEDLSWFADRGPAQLLHQITAPTLLLQGTADTLFTLREAILNYRALTAAQVPTKMVWFCGGHGVCTTNAGAPGHVESVTLNWFARYLKDQPVSTGAGFEYVDDTGTWRGGDSYPLPSAGTISGTGSGVLPVSPAGSAQSGVLVAATPAVNAVNVAVSAPDHAGQAVGEPTLNLTYSGTGTPASTHLYAQLVDMATGKVLGNQTTPIPVVLDGATHTITRTLEGIAVAVGPTSDIRLQITDDSDDYTQQRSAGTVTVQKAEVSVPLVSPSGVVAAAPVAP